MVNDPAFGRHAHVIRRKENIISVFLDEVPQIVSLQYPPG